MGNIFSKIKSLSNNINIILFINRWTNKKNPKLDARTVFKILHPLYAKQLVNTTTSNIVYIYCNPIKKNRNFTI